MTEQTDLTPLQEEVRDEIEYYVEEGYTLKDFIEDLSEHGCISGMVTSLIYYDDTVKFYDKHQIEIDNMLTELCNDTGCSPAELFGNKWDDSDPLAISCCMLY